MSAPARRVEVLRNATLREEVHRAVLPGELQVYVCPKPGFAKRYASYAAHYGSIDSEFTAPGEEAPCRVPDGIAHFLEHTIFETPLGNVSELFARNGAYSNAATSFNTTSYLFSSSQRFYENLSLLLSFVENPAFDPAKVEKEKGIISEEIRMYQDDPGWVGYMGLLESLFSRHPLRIDIAGSEESIRRIDVESLERCYRTFYSRPNMILFVIGDLDPGQVFDFVEKNSKDGGAAAAGGRGAGTAGGAAGGQAVRRFYPHEPGEPARQEFLREMEVALPKLLVGFKEVDIPMEGKAYLERELVTEFTLDYLFGRGSDVFQRFYEAQLILDDFSANYHSSAGVGYAAIGGETPRPRELREAIGQEISKARGTSIPADDFRRQKRKFMGSFIRHFNSLEYIAGNYTYFRFHKLDLFEAIDALEAIRKEDLEARLETLFDPGRSAMSLVVPKR